MVWKAVVRSWRVDEGDRPGRLRVGLEREVLGRRAEGFWWVSSQAWANADCLVSKSGSASISLEMASRAFWRFSSEGGGGNGGRDSVSQ